MRSTWRTPGGAGSAPVVSFVPPGSCPSCQSVAIVTTAKIPDDRSYWRCTACGEIWNDSRGRNVARSWR